MLEASSDTHPPLTVDLAGVFRRHRRVHVAFSGGKDSIILAHLCRRWREQVTLVWCNTGIMWPHMERFVRDYAREFRFLEAKPKQSVFAHWWQQGLPVNVLPYENAVGLAQPKMQFWANCCATLRFLPINELLVTDGATAFLHGQRASDNAPSQKHHQSIGSSLAATVEVAGPLWEWADADVVSYIGRHDLKLPVQYHGAKGSSLECAVCPAFKEAAEKNGFATAMADEAKKLVAELSEGYPHFLQEFLYFAFEADTDNVIDKGDVQKSLFDENGVFDQLGKKYFSDFYISQIGSDAYRHVLQTMAEHMDDWIDRATLIRESGLKEGIVDNALRALKARKIISQNPAKKGEYRLPTKSFAVWIKVQQAVGPDPRIKHTNAAGQDEFGEPEPGPA